MRSLRSRILALVLGLLGLSMSLISYLSYRDAQHEIEELFDAQLAQTARLLQGMLSRTMPEQARRVLQDALNQALAAQRQAGEEALPLGHRYESKLAFQVFDERGQVLLQSASVPHEGLGQALLGLARATDGAPRQPPAEALAARAVQLVGYHYVPLPAHRWRVFMLHDPRNGHWILVGEREDVRGELVEKIALRSLLPDLIGLPLLALLLWLAVGWGLQPLRQMVGLIKTRAPDNLAPLLVAPLPQELEPMVAALNRLLLQITQLLEREKRFLADAAHELRTPLAVLRIHAQNALEAPDRQDRENALQQLGGGVARATRVVAQLLTLARLEPNAVQLAMRELDVQGFFRNELAELIPLALERQQELTLDVQADGDYRLRADGASLGILLQNLLSNAVQYTPPGGRIQVRLEALADAVLLRVQDSGPGVPEALREKLFERFFRQGGGQGAGLGLSIVQRVVELHRGEIGLADSPLGGLEVRVRLPRH